MEARVWARKCDAKEDHEALKAELRRENPGAIVQSCREEYAGTIRFLGMIAAQTLASAQSGQLLAKKPEMDLLLRLSGTAQIAKAIGKAGARRGEPFVIIVVSGKRNPSPRTFGEPLPEGELSRNDLQRVEEAALLSGLKA